MVWYLLIILLGLGSYLFAFRNIWHGKYQPNVFSRGVWFLLAVNSFAGVVFSEGTKASIVLASLYLVGCLGMFILSFKNGHLKIGRLEIFCLILLGLSGILWITSSVPIVNLGLSILGHFIGALPTYKKVWLRPKSESKVFWGLFFLSSLLSVFASTGSPVEKQLLPIYFVLFDGGMLALCLRHFKPRTK